MDGGRKAAKLEVHAMRYVALAGLAVLPALAFGQVLPATATGVAGAEARFANFEGGTLRYLNGGSGATAIVFVHGWSCDATFWRDQLDAFPNTRVIAVDLPGHGQSTAPKVDYTIDYFARSIDAVLQQAGVTHAVLVGHSMGAPVIRQFYRAHPDKTLGLVIVDGGLRLPDATQGDQLVAQLRKDYLGTARRMVNGMSESIGNDTLKRRIRSTMMRTPEHVTISAMHGMFEPTLYATDQMKVPVLAVVARSSFGAGNYEGFLRTLAPRLEFHMWDGVGHFLMMEKPAEFNQTLHSFLMKNSLIR
jgi:pimeloyl-ACP methyl ester carboxylesterase